jgi:Uncharacterized membrane protein, required for colicin V production
MNWLDITIVVLVVAGIVKGLSDGLINQLFSILALIMAILFAGLVARPIRELFFLIPGMAVRPEVLSVISYILAFAVIMSIIALVGKLVNVVIKFTPAVVLNKAAGAILGAGLWLIALSLIINVVATFDANSALIKEDIKEGSILYEPVRHIVPDLYPVVRDFFAE